MYIKKLHTDTIHPVFNIIIYYMGHMDGRTFTIRIPPKHPAFSGG